MRLSDHQAEFAADVARLIRMVDLSYPRLRLRLGHAYRSIEEQQRLMDAGISKVRKPESSKHTQRLAVDLILDKLDGTGIWVYQTKSDEYKVLGDMWEAFSKHNRWGGRWQDGNHFERLEHQRLEDLEVYEL